jgi:mRNA interferase MazF
MTGPAKPEIWQVDFVGSIGHEQKKARPCVIWKDLDHIGMAVAIPFTGTSEAGNFSYTHPVEPSLANGLEKESVALVFQIRSVDKKRMMKKIGALDAADTRAIEGLLRDMLDL